MNNKEFNSEMKYQTTMTIARNLLKQGIINDEEYSRIDTMFAQKYAPKIGTLLANINLINAGNYGNM